MLEIILPFPDIRLSPNKRLCWQAKIKLKEAQRNAGYVAAFPYRNKIVQDKLPIKLFFCPKDKRRYDLDNLLANCKSLIDGVAMGIGIDDRNFRPITIDFGEIDKVNPHVLMYIG
jgi:crossover junction endodeoxyribonuclease RusA